ncbi:hypothetical protein GW17_00012919 [Ensete ventricosum]|nr:hypothetical protein GW17_00012919 [Ensete ventricosum]RZS20621.1 hypothetical protein BHM03_00053153 [Ensete ventricosum]
MGPCWCWKKDQLPAGRRMNTMTHSFPFLAMRIQRNDVKHMRPTRVSTHLRWRRHLGAGRVRPVLSMAWSSREGEETGVVGGGCG